MKKRASMARSAPCSGTPIPTPDFAGAFLMYTTFPECQLHVSNEKIVIVIWRSRKIAEYEYVVVPFRGRMKSGQTIRAVNDQLQELIDKYAEKGWEFWQLANVNIEMAPGRLAALFGQKASYHRYDHLIFRMPK